MRTSCDPIDAAGLRKCQSSKHYFDQQVHIILYQPCNQKIGFDVFFTAFGHLFCIIWIFQDFNDSIGEAVGIRDRIIVDGNFLVVICVLLLQ